MMIIPEDERCREIPLEGPGVLTHPDMMKALEWVFECYQPPVKKYAVFLPCSVRKPYHESPSHKLFDSVVFKYLPREDTHIVVFGTCGIVPRELDEEYPFSHYKFVLGKCTIPEIKETFIEIETERISRYLLKTRNNYKVRIAYCLGEFREAMKRASEQTNVHVHILPKRLIKCGKKFPYGSLSQSHYLNELDRFLSELVRREDR
jgi:predicted RNA-binding protein